MSPKIYCPKKLGFKRNFGSKGVLGTIFFGKSIIGQKKFWVEEMLDQKILVQKMFGPKKIRSKKVRVQKNFGSKIFW